MLRGGSWNNNQDNARCAYRNNNHPDNRNNNSHFGKKAVIPAGMQESSHRDVKPQDYDRLAVARSLPSLDAGCIQDILVLYPSGGEAVQIGYPADLSGIHEDRKSVV